jgi:hypothetical protein
MRKRRNKIYSIRTKPTYFNKGKHKMKIKSLKLKFFFFAIISSKQVIFLLLRLNSIVYSCKMKAKNFKFLRKKFQTF